jgi:hypothetical protein
MAIGSILMVIVAEGVLYMSTYVQTHKVPHFTTKWHLGMQYSKTKTRDNGSKSVPDDLRSVQMSPYLSQRYEEVSPRDIGGYWNPEGSRTWLEVPERAILFWNILEGFTRVQTMRVLGIQKVLEHRLEAKKVPLAGWLGQEGSLCLGGLLPLGRFGKESTRWFPLRPTIGEAQWHGYPKCRRHPTRRHHQTIVFSSPRWSPTLSCVNIVR